MIEYVYGYINIWVYGYMGIWVYKYMGIWVYKYMGIWVYSCVWYGVLFFVFGFTISCVYFCVNGRYCISDKLIVNCFFT